MEMAKPHKQRHANHRRRATDAARRETSRWAHSTKAPTSVCVAVNGRGSVYLRAWTGGSG